MYEYHDNVFALYHVTKNNSTLDSLDDVIQTCLAAGKIFACLILQRTHGKVMLYSNKFKLKYLLSMSECICNNFSCDHSRVLYLLNYLE